MHTVRDTERLLGTVDRGWLELFYWGSLAYCSNLSSSWNRRLEERRLLEDLIRIGVLWSSQPAQRTFRRRHLVLPLLIYRLNVSVLL